MSRCHTELIGLELHTIVCDEKKMFTVVTNKQSSLCSCTE